MNDTSNIAWQTLIYQGIVYDNFQVSTDGQIKNIKTGIIYKQCINKNGYYQVCVSLGSRKKMKVFRIHKAVAETFIPNPENKPEVNHKDCNKLNNNVWNLEWTTCSENTQHAHDNGLIHVNRGSDHFAAKLTEEDVRFIKEHYIPRSEIYGSRALGRQFGVDHMQILRIIHGKKYVNVS